MLSRRPLPRMNRGRIATTVSAGTPLPPTGPTPLLLTPESGDSFQSDEGTIIIHAAIPAGAPAVTKVDFYAGASLLGTANAAPWEYQWTTFSANTAYSITAKATYADATTGTSAAASITVAAARTFLLTSIAQLGIWGDPTNNASITMGVSPKVQTVTRFRDGAKYPTDLTQATTGSQPTLSKLRGQQALLFSNATSLSATVTGTLGFPHTFVQVFKPMGSASAANANLAGGIARLSYRGTTWPRTKRWQTSVVLDESITKSATRLEEFLANNTSSEVRVNGVATLPAPQAGGTTGISATVTWGGSEPGVSGDYAIFNGAVSGADLAAYQAELIAKYHINEPAFNLMVVGDSIARGFASTDLCGFRSIGWSNYWSRGKVAGHWIEEIGQKLEGGGRVFGGDSHYGIDNKGINYMRTNLPALIGTTTEQFAPHIMVLHIGINNAASVAGETYVSGTGAGSTRDEFRNLITDIYTKLPNVQLIVANLPNNALGATQTNVTTLNATWFTDADAAASALGKTLQHWDVNTALGANPGANFADNTHPSDAGYAAMTTPLWPLIVQACANL